MAYNEVDDAASPEQVRDYVLAAISLRPDLADDWRAQWAQWCEENLGSASALPLEAEKLQKEYNPDEPRNARGEWTDGEDDSQPQPRPGSTPEGLRAANDVMRMQDIMYSAKHSNLDGDARDGLLKAQVSHAIAERCPVSTNALARVAEIDQRIDPTYPSFVERVSSVMGTAGDKDGLYIDGGEIFARELSPAYEALSPEQRDMCNLTTSTYWDRYIGSPDNPKGAGGAWSGTGATADQIIREEAVSRLIHTWAVSSNDNNETMLAMQKAAEKEFGISGAKQWDMSNDTRVRVAAKLDDQEGVMRSFLRTQYNLTQEHLKGLGVSEITLGRGMMFIDREDAGPLGKTMRNENVEVVQRPLASWSRNIEVARGFADGGTIEGYVAHVHSVLVQTVPVSQILSTPYTGFGCFREGEFVTLGGVTKVEASTHINA